MLRTFMLRSLMFGSSLLRNSDVVEVKAEETDAVELDVAFPMLTSQLMWTRCLCRDAVDPMLRLCSPVLRSVELGTLMLPSLALSSHLL